jgi:acyl-[acyl carrier protein]--UDP-N-acetylglucosamine O-acyltransferase
MAFGDHVELAGLNLIGLKRRGLSRDTINALRNTFRTVFYGKDGSLADRAERVFVWNTRPKNLEYYTEKWNEFLAT